MAHMFSLGNQMQPEWNNLNGHVKLNILLRSEMIQKAYRYRVFETEPSPTPSMGAGDAIVACAPAGLLLVSSELRHSHHQLSAAAMAQPTITCRHSRIRLAPDLI